MKFQNPNNKLQTIFKFKIQNTKHVWNLVLSALDLFVIWCLVFGASPAHAAVDLGDKYAFGYITTLGDGVNRLVRPTFSIAIAVVIVYFLIGAFKYLTSAGDKEAVAGARGMITHAIIGFMILIFAFLVLQFGLSALFGIEGLQIFSETEGQ